MPRNVALWSEQDWTHDRIERYFQRQNLRMSAGVWLQDDFSRLLGAIAVWQGRGKYLQLNHCEFQELDLPASLQSELQQLFADSAATGAQCRAVASDLVEHQARVTRQLQRRAGKFLDRIVTVSIDGPPRYIEDFDGKVGVLPYFDAIHLAELTGANIVDAIPDRDLAAGGTGRCLHALPCWLMFSDREKRDARGKLLVIARRPIELLWLPASDGADEVVPEISFRTVAAQSELPASLAKFLADVGGQQACEEIITIGMSQPDHLIAALSSSGLAAAELPARAETRFPTADHLAAVTSAMWGMLFVDQMPGNLPELTGASSQRVLGRVVPGRPFAWRTLVQNMSDGTAPTMRLRDVV